MVRFVIFIDVTSLEIEENVWMNVLDDWTTWGQERERLREVRNEFVVGNAFARCRCWLVAICI